MNLGKSMQCFVCVCVSRNTGNKRVLNETLNMAEFQKSHKGEAENLVGPFLFYVSLIFVAVSSVCSL